MSSFTISREDYEAALINATDSGYRAHLLNDFVRLPDGSVAPRVDYVKVNDRTYRERVNFIEVTR